MPSEKEILDFLVRLDTKDAGRDLGKMQDSFRNLRKTAEESNKGTAKEVHKVEEALNQSKNRLKELRKKYEEMGKANHLFAQLATSAWKNVKESVEEGVNTQNAYSKAVKKVAKLEEELGKTRESLAHKEQALADATVKKEQAKAEAAKAATEEQKQAAEEAGKAAEQAALDAESAYAKEIEAVEKLNEKLAKQKKLAEEAKGVAANKKKRADENLESIKPISEAGQRASDRAKEQKETEQKAINEFHDTLSDYSFKNAGSDLFEGLNEGISALKSKDPFGIIKSVGKAVFKPAAMGAGKAAQSASVAATGDLSKGLAGSMGKMAGMVGKLGPMLSIASGLVVGLVQLFLDAQAAAKEFNRELLNGVSTAGYMGQSASKSIAEMTLDLKDARNAAMDPFFNNKWGITPKDHATFMNTLGQEGQGLAEIGKQAQQAGQDVGEFNQNLVATGVTYSRIFGASMQDIGQMTGQLMTETGMSIKSVETAFQQVLIASKDSGIASNKFFAIIKSMSADISLFNLRMEEAAGVLKAVGKAMSARNAEKFLQSMSSFYKGMGIEDRIKHTRMAGTGNVKGALTKDFAAKNKGLAFDFEKTTGEKGSGEALLKAMQGSQKDLRDFLVSYGDKIPSAMREAIFDSQRAGKQAKGGLVNTAAALRNSSPGATMEILNQISKNRVGSKLSDAQEINYLAIQQITGLTEEQIDGFYKMGRSLDMYRGEIGKRIGEGKMTKNDQDFLAKAGIDTTNKTPEEIRKAIESLDDSQVFNALSTDQQKAAQGIEETKNYAKMQTDFLQGISEKMDNVMQFLMNQFYEAVVGIWDSIASYLGLGNDPALQEAKEQRNKNRKKRLEKAQQEEAQAAKQEADKKLSQWLGVQLPPESVLGNPTGENIPSFQVNWSAPGLGGKPNTTGAPTVGATTQPTISAPFQASTESHTEAVEDQTKQQAKDAKKLLKVVKKDGIEIRKQTIEGPMKKSVGDATLESFRKALFEQYLYKDVPVGEMVQGIRQGSIGASGPGEDVFNQLRANGVYTPLEAHADGGIVVKPAPGELVASVAPGETIVPKGGSMGGVPSNVSITVNGDAPSNFKRHMENTVRRGIDEYRKMQRSGN